MPTQSVASPDPLPSPKKPITDASTVDASADDSSAPAVSLAPSPEKSNPTTNDSVKEADIDKPSIDASVDDAVNAAKSDTRSDTKSNPGEDDEITMNQLQAAVDDLDENLDEAFGHAADTLWSFATSVTGRVSSVVGEQPRLQSLKDNVTSRFSNLDTIGRDLQSQLGNLGNLAPTQDSIANITGSMKSVAETVQRNAVAMEKAILAKANEPPTEPDTGDKPEDMDVIPDPALGVMPVSDKTDGLDGIAKVGETVSKSVTNAFEQTVGGLWSGLWGGDDQADEFVPKEPKTRFEKKIFELQANPDTYCEPASDLNAFEVWGADFNLDNYEDQCRELLRTHGAIAELYVDVVPNIIEEDTFWMRYFFAKHVLEKEEERRKRLLEQAENAVDQNEEEDGWGDDDWDDDEEPDGDGEAKVDVKDRGNPEKESGKTGDGEEGEAGKDTENDVDDGQSKDSKVVKKAEVLEKSAGKVEDAASKVRVAADDNGDDDWGTDDWE